MTVEELQLLHDFTAARHQEIARLPATTLEEVAVRLGRQVELNALLAFTDQFFKKAVQEHEEKLNHLSKNN